MDSGLARGCDSGSGSEAVKLDFPLCADEAADAVARPAVVEAVRFLEGLRGPQAFEAVILTGSFSRGEGSVLLTNPHHRILGDVEFLVIARPPFDYPRLRREMKILGQRATKQLRTLGYDAAIEYSPAGRGYLERAIRPSVFTFDLLAHGKTVAGDPALLDAVPRFDRSAIPREDAVRLVMNRMMEIHALKLRRHLEPLVEAYVGVKTVLDLAGSILAFEGRYLSTYRGRDEALGEVSYRAGLESDLARSVRLKLHPREEELLRDAPRLDAALDRALDVWRWEMERLVGGKDIRELLNGFLSSERMWQTVRGWIKYYTHPLRPSREGVSLGRSLRLFFRASPQRLAYASALLAHQGEREGAAYLLPSTGSGGPLPQAIELWSWLVRNN